MVPPWRIRASFNRLPIVAAVRYDGGQDGEEDDDEEVDQQEVPAIGSAAHCKGQWSTSFW